MEHGVSQSLAQSFTAFLITMFSTICIKKNTEALRFVGWLRLVYVSFLNTKDTKVLFNSTSTGAVQVREEVFLTTKGTKILATHGFFTLKRTQRRFALLDGC